MKFFIVAAMVVATVAGQSFNMFNKYGQDKSILMNKFYGKGNEMLYKKLGYPMVDTYGQRELVDLPMYLQDQYVDKVFTIDELYNMELFKEYLSLPLFREYITMPMFQKYIQSVYFQKFWTVPAFKQYFVNPVLFYKYIYPIVQLFKYDTITYDQEIVNKNILPFVSGHESDLFVPTTTYNKEIQDGIYYKNLLDTIYTQILGQQNKIVDPITGEVKMIPFHGLEGDLVKHLLLKKYLSSKNVNLDMVFGDKLVTDMIVKKNIDTQLLKKILTLKNLDMNLFGDNVFNKKNVDVDFLSTVFNKNTDVLELIKMTLLQKMMDTTIPQEYQKMNPIQMTYGGMYNKGFPYINTLDTVTKMNLFDILGKKQTIDEIEKMNLFDILSKKDLVIKDKMVLNKILADKVNEIENFGTFETIPKMVEDVTKFERVPLTLEGVKPMMGVRTFDKVIKA